MLLCFNTDCVVDSQSLYETSFNQLLPIFHSPQRAPGEIRPVISLSASLDLASVFIYNRRSSIIRIMRRKGAHNSAHYGALCSPFRQEIGFLIEAVCAVKNTVGDTTSLQPRVLFRLISIGQSEF